MSRPLLHHLISSNHDKGLGGKELGQGGMVLGEGRACKVWVSIWGRQVLQSMKHQQHIHHKHHRHGR